MWIAQGDSMNKRNWPKNMLTQNPSSNQNYILPKTIPKIFPPKAHLTTVAAIHSWSTIKLSVHSYSFQFSHARIARSLTSFVVCANLFIHHTLPLYLSASSDDCRFVHCIIGCQLLLLCFPSLSLRTVCWSAKNSSERTATEDGSHVQCINVTLPLNSPHSSFVFYVGMWKL